MNTTTHVTKFKMCLIFTLSKNRPSVGSLRSDYFLKDRIPKQTQPISEMFFEIPSVFMILLEDITIQPF